MNSLTRSFLTSYVSVFSRKSLYGFHVLLYKLSLRGMGLLNYENTKVSGEKAFLRYLTRHGKLNAGVIFDIGANIGHYAVMLRQHNISLPIYAFEPHPVSFKKLRETAARYDFTPIRKGAGDRETQARIYDYSGNTGSEHASMYRAVIEQLHSAEAAETSIQLTTIDAFIEEHSIRKIALLKIDTEGNELNVLKGAREAIRKGYIDVIQLEFNEMNVIARTFFKDIINELPGYEFYRLLPDGLISLGKYNAPMYEIFAFQNIVAIRNDYPQ